MLSILDLFFPKSCVVCSRKGEYLCDKCRKLFKRSLPECYVCRRLSKNYLTHTFCAREYSLDRLFVGWEYDSISSLLLKRYKYGSVYDISKLLSLYFLEILDSSSFGNFLNNSLITFVPISSQRLNDRGFNQVYRISEMIANLYSLDLNKDLLGKRYTKDHQSLKSRDERISLGENPFYINIDLDISKYESITIVDDVITTGMTLEYISEILRKKYGKDLIINGICMFRGRAYYSDSCSESAVSSLS